MFIGVAADYPALIPHVSGKEIVRFEKSVNGLLKVILKAKSMGIEHIIILSPQAPRLHHRYASSGNNMLVRSFASELTEKEILLEFFPDIDVARYLALFCFDAKVGYEELASDNKIQAIDDGSLSLLYYAKECGWNPTVTIVSHSDIGSMHMQRLGKAIGKMSSVVEKNMGIFALGELKNEPLYKKVVCGEHPMQELDQRDDIIADVVEGNTLFASLMPAFHAAQKDSSSYVPYFHVLAEEEHQETLLLSGFFEE